MKTNITIFNKLNESEEPITLDSMIDALITDEKEAIEQYNNALTSFNNIGLPDNKINDVTYVISHIIEEEEEHIKELEQLRNTLNK